MQIQQYNTKTIDYMYVGYPLVDDTRTYVFNYK